MIPKEKIDQLYTKEKKSVSEIANSLKCSEGKVNYWIKRHGIKKRSLSDALYQKHNPLGDPFKFEEPLTLESSFLYGLGIGLYWGEGTKSNTHSVRLGNTDPELIEKFILFLDQIFHIDKEKLSFGLQVFSDMDPIKAKKFWRERLNVKEDQFQKVIVTQQGKVGTYKNKTQHGVLTVYFNNKKLRDILCSSIPRS